MMPVSALLIVEQPVIVLPLLPTIPLPPLLDAEQLTSVALDATLIPLPVLPFAAQFDILEPAPRIPVPVFRHAEQPVIVLPLTARIPKAPLPDAEQFEIVVPTPATEPPPVVMPLWALPFARMFAMRQLSAPREGESSRRRSNPS